MSAPLIATVVCCLATAVLVIAEALASARARRVAKPIASLAFVLVAVTAAQSGSYTTWIIAGLILGALGDIALLGESRRALAIGIALFLAGHLAYVGAFTSVGAIGTVAIVGGVIAAIIGVTAGLVIWPTAGKLRGAVAAYIAVIVAMVAAALSTDSRLIITGGVLFFASDLAVARQRFIKKSFFNRAWGLPCYYAGQLLIAWSVAP